MAQDMQMEVEPDAEKVVVDSTPENHGVVTASKLELAETVPSYNGSKAFCPANKEDHEFKRQTDIPLVAETVPSNYNGSKAFCPANKVQEDHEFKRQTHDIPLVAETVPSNYNGSKAFCPANKVQEGHEFKRHTDIPLVAETVPSNYNGSKAFCPANKGQEDHEFKRHTDIPKRAVMWSNRSIGQSPLHPNRAKIACKGRGASSPSLERKASSDGISQGFVSLTIQRSLTARGNRSWQDGDGTVPKFGDWDENNPSSADRYSQTFEMVREEKLYGPPVFGTEITSSSKAHKQYNAGTDFKSWCCVPWSRK